MLTTACDDGYVRFWSLDSLSDNPECITESRQPLCCSYSANGHVIATGNREGTIQVFRPQGTQVAKLQHICRMKIRRHVQQTQGIDLLSFPIRLKEYLKYKHL